MNPVTSDAIMQVLTIAVPAVLTFLLGHFHVLLSNPAVPSLPSAPSKPATPATPAPSAPLAIGEGGILQALQQILAQLQQGTPVVGPTFPTTPAIATVGQGGLLQLISLTLQGIMSHPTATPAEKAAAASQVVSATASLTTPTK